MTTWAAKNIGQVKSHTKRSILIYIILVLVYCARGGIIITAKQLKCWYACFYYLHIIDVKKLFKVVKQQIIV